jgi:hypothetical protein
MGCNVVIIPPHPPMFFETIAQTFSVDIEHLKILLFLWLDLE